MAEEKERRKVKILNAETARKIAAGEVIDRPASIVRELLDNAVDSGATEINVEIEGGGIDKIRVQDNGCGMSREDLAVAAHPHATSKISSDTDLLNLTTLGFRGEALASIAAVARLTISSGEWKMRCSITEDHIIEPRSPIAGTVVSSENLFENFPARRQFLKRPASETKMCRQTFLEKALPRPDIAFRLSVDGQLRNDFRAGQSLRERFYEALGIQQSPDLFYEIKGSGAGFSFSLVVGDPCVARQDRKDIYIYVNGRRIAEYSLVQAIEYGTQGYFPNGTHPAAALFAQVQPDMVDFNIHPAKKEARFKDIAGLHHGVSSALREFFRALSVKQMKSGLDGTEEERQNAFSFSQESFESPKSAASLSDLADLAGEGASPAASWATQKFTDAASPLGTQLDAPQSDASQKSAGLSGAAQSWSSGQSAAPQSWPSGALPSYGAGRAPRISERPQNLRVASPGAFSASQQIAASERGNDKYVAAASWAYEKSLDAAGFQQSYESPKSAAPSASQNVANAASFKYIGRALGTFIIVEKKQGALLCGPARRARALFVRQNNGRANAKTAAPDSGKNRA
jgi:DNA mismatch repair protein MutL